MKDDFIKSRPYFFRLIGRSMLLATVGIMTAALLVPAPLREAANPAVTPNPVRSAWFLLWIQEVVSWTNLMLYPLMVLPLALLLLPWLSPAGHAHRACWFPRRLRAVNFITVVVAIAILVLTVIASYFRGENWSLVLP